MATNLALDDRLIDAAVKAGGHRSKRDAVMAALQEYVKLKRRQGVFDLVGTVEYYEDYDYKAARRAKKRP